MHRTASVIAIATGLCALVAGCSSGGGTTASSSSTDATVILPVTTTTGTTLPEPQLRNFLAGFFASPQGKTLLEFERVTQPLANGHVPSVPLCQKFIHTILPPIAQPQGLQVLITKIPDPELVFAFHQDIGGKDLLLAACDTSTRPPQSAADAMKQVQENLRTVLAKHGYKI